MSSTTINARINSDLKIQAEAIFEALGLSTSDAIRIFFHRVVAEHGLPFALKVKEPVPAQTQIANLANDDALIGIIEGAPDLAQTDEAWLAANHSQSWTWKQ